MATKIKLPPIEIGVMYQVAIRWSSTGEFPGATVDLDEWEGRAQYRRAAGSPLVLLDISTANGMMDLAGDMISLTVPASVTKDIPPAEGEFDVVLWPTGVEDNAIRLVFADMASIQIVTESPAP